MTKVAWSDYGEPEFNMPGLPDLNFGRGADGMHIHQLGEFGLIERITHFLPPAPDNVIVGLGDDVAVLRCSTADYLLATCDSQVEQVHFLRKHITPYQLGRKIVAINVSDIAAMGGVPEWALVSLVLPRDTEVAWVDELYRGMREQAAMAAAAIVGGNLSGTQGDVVIDLCLMGRVAPEHMLRRNGAQAGDLIMVTGTLGDSRAGLELIHNAGLRIADQSREAVRQRHLTPQPRLLEGRLLGRSGKVHAMLDVSDGLLSDLDHICQASGVGAELWTEAIPVSTACREVAHEADREALEWALTGGEDYELLFCAAPDSATELQNRLEQETRMACHAIGRITDQSREIQLVLADGSRSRVETTGRGWDHFAENGTVLPLRNQGCEPCEKGES